MNRFLLVLWLMQIISCDPFGNLLVVPTSYVIQDVTDYLFTLQLSGDGVNNYVVPVGSDLVIYFPEQYPLLAGQNHSCSIITWPTAFSPISCTLTYQTLTIKDAFTTSMTIDKYSTYTFKWIVNLIDNPQFSQTTSYFRGVFQNSNVPIFAQFAPSNYLGLTITPGNLVVNMAVGPTATDQTSNLTVTVTPSHAIPVGGYLKISFSSTWSTAIYSTYILNSQTSCLGITNTAPNMGCTYVLVAPNYVITATNIYTAKSSSMFSFNITNFRNPPTTQPLGNFIFQTYNSTDTSTGAVIDESSNNVVSGVTPADIQNPLLYLSQYLQGTTVQADITVTITNVVSKTDVFYVQVPSEMDISGATVISIASVTVETGSLSILSSTLISFRSKFEVSNPNPINITIDKLTLPPYATTITSPFFVYVKRNTYFVCYVSKVFNFQLKPGTVTSILTASSTVAGVSADYNFSMVFQHSISSTAKIGFAFSATYFAIGAGITCQSSKSTNCTVLSTLGNIVEISSVTSSSTNSLEIVLFGLTNPSSIGAFSAVSIYTYTFISPTYYLVDSDSSSSFFSLTARPMALLDFNLSASSSTVHSSSTFSFEVRNNNKVPTGAYIVVYIPTEITYSNVGCNVVCVSGTFSGKKGIQMQQIGPLNAGIVSTFTVSNMVNPISTRPTTAFSVQFYNSNNILLEYLTAGSNFQATIPSTLTMNVSPSSSKNSDICQYTLTYSTTFTIADTVALIVVVPISQSCPSCTAQTYNSTHHELVFFGQTMINNTFSLVLSNMGNFYSYEPQNIKGAIMSNDLLYFYANGSTTSTTSQSSIPSFGYQFTRYELNTAMDLIISNLSSATLSSRVGKVRLVFGSDFNLTLLVCSPLGYTCLVSGSQIDLTVTTLGSLPTITISNIASPSLSPSTKISLLTYTQSDYLIDQSQSILWSASCQLPCRTCLPSNISSCLACYSDQVIAQGRVLYFGPNSTCVSECGDRYYKNYTLNACELCSSSCSNCLNFSICTSCPSSYYLLTSTCYLTCPLGYYPHLTQCLLCTSSLNCYTCVNELTCASCSGSYYYYELKCLIACPSNTTTQNATTHTCDYCPSNCSTCYLSATDAVVCTACFSGYLDAGRCLQLCETIGTVPSGSVCSFCDVSCLTCKGDTTFCLTCNTSSTFKYFMGNKCYVDCPATYYNDNNTFSCLPCTMPCETCSGYSSNACTSCISNYSLLGTVCGSSCPQQYYSNSISCLTCVEPCLTCASALFCFTCVVNYSLVTSNYTCITACPEGYVSISQVCQPCSSNCLTCTTQTVCSTCPSSTYLFNGTCINPCVAGYFPNSTLGQCQKCYFSCSACDNYTYCLSCLTGYELQSDFSCLSLCPSAQVPISGICLNCTAGCSACQQTTTQCTACSGVYIFSPSEYKCYLQCPSTLFLSTSSQCVAACNNDQYVVLNTSNNVSQCVQCPSFCSSCISAFVCGACVSGTYMLAGLCYAVCPGSAPYAIGTICKSCNVVDCQTCASTSCIICSSGKYLIGTSLCISGCSSNEVYNPTNKTCDIVITVDPNSGGGGNTTTIITPTDTTLNFIPMPFLIVFAITSVFVVIMHVRGKIEVVPTLYGLAGPTLTLNLVTTLVVGFLSSDSPVLVLGGLYCLILGATLVLVCSAISIVFWYRDNREKAGIAVLSTLHFSIFSLMTSNFSNYNSYFLEEHRLFWRKYRILSKVGLFFLFFPFIGGVLLCFGVANKYIFTFYAGVEVTILSFLVFVLQMLWIWLPLKEPPHDEVISQKSTEILMDSQVDKHSENHEHQNNKIRMSEIKTEGDNIHHQRNQLPKVKSNYQFNSINNVVKISPGEIAQGLQKGLFRRSEQQLMKDMRLSEQMSNLDSAQKMNLFMQMSNDKKEVQQDIANTKVQTKGKNIFQQHEQDMNEDDLGLKHQDTIFHSHKDLKEESDLDSGDNAIFDQPLVIKEEDFRHNIIFEEDDEEDLTNFNQEHQSTPDLNRDGSLGNIVEKQTLEVKVESRDSSAQRLPSPIFGNTKGTIEKIEIQDIDDEFEESRIQLFNSHANKIKPMYSKDLPKKVKGSSFELPKEVVSFPTEIIHADFEQIISVEDRDSVEFIEENNDYHDSSRRIAGEKNTNGAILDLDRGSKTFFGAFREEDRPSSFFKQTAKNYQPGIEKNEPPVQKKERGSYISRKR